MSEICLVACLRGAEGLKLFSTSNVKKLWIVLFHSKENEKKGFAGFTLIGIKLDEREKGDTKTTGWERGRRGERMT
jgi:hypothetical protein